MSKPHIKIKDGKPIITHDSGGKAFISDSLTNVMSGLNTSSDPRSYNQYNFSNHGVWDWLFTNPMQLYAAYRSSWLARRIVESQPKDALRPWRQFECSEVEDIQYVEKKLRLATKYTELCSLANLSGGAIMVMMIDGQDLAKPLDLNRIKKDSLKAVQVFDRYELSWSELNITNPLSDNFLCPEYYLISGGEQIIHHSNVITMAGADLPRLLRRMEGGGWGDSKLRQCMEDLTDTEASRAGIAAMLQKANQDVIKMAGLKEAVTTSQEDQIIKRVQLFKMGMSNHSLGMLDQTEDLARISLSFGGTSEALNQLMIWISGAAGIPMTRLFGIQSKGMNNDGTGDLKNYYDELDSLRESKYRHGLEYLDEVLVRSAVGYWPEDCEWSWLPLFQESGSEKAQQSAYQSQADATYMESNIVMPSQVMRRLEAEGTYFFPEGFIDKQEKYDLKNQEDKLNGASDPYGNNTPDILGGFGGDEEDPQAEENKGGNS